MTSNASDFLNENQTQSINFSHLQLHSSYGAAKNNAMLNLWLNSKNENITRFRNGVQEQHPLLYVQ